MRKDTINRFEEDDRVKAARQALRDVEKEYQQEDKAAALAEKKKYRDWYKSLSEEDRFDEDIRKMTEELRATKRAAFQAKRTRERAKTEEKRKARTHYLIQLGAELDAALRHYYPQKFASAEDFSEKDIAILKTFLYSTGSKGDAFFPRYWEDSERKYDESLKTSAEYSVNEVVEEQPEKRSDQEKMEETSRSSLFDLMDGHKNAG